MHLQRHGFVQCSSMTMPCVWRRWRRGIDNRSSAALGSSFSLSGGALMKAVCGCLGTLGCQRCVGVESVGRGGCRGKGLESRGGSLEIAAGIGLTEAQTPLPSEPCLFSDSELDHANLGRKCRRPSLRTSGLLFRNPYWGFRQTWAPRGSQTTAAAGAQPLLYQAPCLDAASATQDAPFFQGSLHVPISTLVGRRATRHLAGAPRR